MKKITSFLKGKKILITGVSGYLGSHLLEELLKYDVHTIRGVSRNETKISELQEKQDDSRTRLYIGDIRDIHRMQKAVEGIDIIYHCAAMKHIDLCERNTFEAVETNIIGTQNLIDLSISNNVEQFIGIDTDKSCGGTLNFYGSTKKLMRQLIINANYIRGSHKCAFSCARWGNILSSSGSVLPKWKDSIKRDNTILITNPKMTRFSLDIQQVINFMIKCQENMIGGEIFIPKMKSYVLGDLATAVIDKYGNKNIQITIINNRGYEKTHEDLIDVGEYNRIYDIEGGYVILPDIKYANEFGLSYNIYNYGKDIYIFDKPYSSNNVEKFTVEELKAMI